MPRSISFHDSSYGSSPPAVLSWWLGAAKISHQDSKVFQKCCSLLFVFVFSFHPKYANILTSKRSVETLFVCFWTEDPKVFQVKHHRWLLRVLSCVHGFKRISELFVFSWNEFCSVLHTSKSGLGKFGLLITLETPHYWSVVDHFQSLWEAFQLNTTNFLWLWIIWCPKKETEKKTWLLLTENYNRVVFLGLIDAALKINEHGMNSKCSGVKEKNSEELVTDVKMFRSQGEKVS